jgi:hypothetical protein
MTQVLVNVDAVPWKPTRPEHHSPKVPTLRDTLRDPDYESRVIDAARRALDDVPECAAANFSVRWLQPGGEPILVLEFTDQGVRQRFGTATPAVAVALTLTKRGTLADPEADRKLLVGDRLRDAVLKNVHHYLDKHGVRPSLTHEEGMRHAHV